MTICNMSIEGGARAGLVPRTTPPSSTSTAAATPRGAAWDAAVARWRELPSDDGATFDTSITSTAAASSR